MRFLCLLLFLAFLPTVTAARVIDRTEHWQGEIRLTEALRVEKGGQLIIAPGSRVVSDAGIEIVGQLQAVDVEFNGANWPGLVLKGTDSQTWLKNCRISGAQTGISVIGGEPQLTGLLLEKNRIGIELRRMSKALIGNSIFRDNSRVGLFLKDETAAMVIDNRFERQGKFGAYIYRALPKKFSGNQFVDNPTGLMISHFASDPLIENNLFRSNGIGIKVDRTARPQITANRFDKNQIAIKLFRRSDPQIKRNLFQQNRQAIHISYSSYPQIRHNDFVGNPQALVLEYQSSLWEKQKGAATRQQQIAGQGAFGGQKQTQVTEEQRRAQSLDGTVDARQNWWGKRAALELENLGAEANLPWITDGRDQPLFEDEGASYPLDRVRWFPVGRQPYTSEVLK